MVVWSCFALKNIGKLSAARSVIASFRKGPKAKGLNYAPVRNCHERTIQIRDSLYTYTKFKDLLILYLFVGIIPLGTIIMYVNLFIGPATLALIPEGYEPKPWEYYRHPITRFFAKFISTHQEVHERNLHWIFYNTEKQMVITLKKKVENLMKNRQDYQAWYYLDPSAKYVRKMSEDTKEQLKNEGYLMGWLK